MDQDALVEKLIADGKQLIDRLMAEGIGVTAAAWLKESYNGRWNLYIATPLVSPTGAKKQAYHEIFGVLRQMPAPFWLTSSHIRAIAPSSPVAERIADLDRRYPGRGPIWYRDYLIGDVSVEGGYIYPPLDSAET